MFPVCKTDGKDTNFFLQFLAEGSCGANTSYCFIIDSVFDRGLFIIVSLSVKKVNCMAMRNVVFIALGVSRIASSCLTSCQGEAKQRFKNKSGR